MGICFLLSTTLAFAAPGWNAASSLQTARDGHTATLLPNGKVLITGGSNDGILASAELYDPATNSWTDAGMLAMARSRHTTTLLPNGKVLVAGGFTQFSTAPALVSASAELYDPATNTWTAAGALSMARGAHTATLLQNGKVLVAGGQGTFAILASAELYDPTTNTWTAAGTLTMARGEHTATLLPDSRVLVVGGGANTELYNPVTDAWTSAGTLATGRSSHTATLLQNGMVLVAGGGNNASTYDGNLNSAELYDPITNAWGEAGELATGRSSHTATLLQNGKMLVAGGHSNAGTYEGNLNSAELYDPATDTWAAAGTMANVHQYHTATLLPNGKVLVVGGVYLSRFGPLYSNGADLYNPASNSLASFPIYRFFNNNTGGHFFTINESEKNTVIANYPWFKYEEVGFYAYSTQVSGTYPVYRFFNNNAGGHFFTISESEKNTVIADYPWFRYEGVGFYAYSTQVSGTYPVYRFFNNNAGGHFFTISESEKNTVINNYSWFHYEGTGFYAYPSP